MNGCWHEANCTDNYPYMHLNLSLSLGLTLHACMCVFMHVRMYLYMPIFTQLPTTNFEPGFSITFIAFPCPFVTRLHGNVIRTPPLVWDAFDRNKIIINFNIVLHCSHNQCLQCLHFAIFIVSVVADTICDTTATIYYLAITAPGFNSPKHISSCCKYDNESNWLCFVDK